jgi:hypothetical protein
MNIGISRKQTIGFVLTIITALILCSCSGGAGTAKTTVTGKPTSASVETKFSETTKQTSQKPENLSTAKAKKVLERFLNADDLHLKMLVTYKTYNPSPVDPKTFELWSRGLNYRSNEYLGDNIKFVTIVKGKDAKQYSMETKHILDPISTPENYTDYFKWDSSKVDAGKIGSDQKYVVFTIDGIDKFYKKENAKSGYYYTKVEFGVDNNSMIYTTLYGNASYGEKPAGVNAVTQTYEFVNINEGFAESVFDAPFQQ